MGKHERFHLKDLSQLKNELSRLKISLPLDEDLSILGDTVSAGQCKIPNRFVVHPMEGFDAEEDGSPVELSFRRYRRYAAGGAGLIWFEATAVWKEARSNPGQLSLHADNVDSFARLTEATRKAAQDAHGRDPVMVLQMTHSGRYSKPHGVPEPLIAHRSPILDPKHELPDDYPVVTDDYLDRLGDAFVEMAKLAAKAGFDGVDVKACHRYLISELLASHTREGKYGGSFENRTRLLRETLDRIKQEVDGVFITTRLNIYDAISHPYGWGVSEYDYRVPDLTEPVRLVRELKEIGIPLLNMSIGNPYYNPHFGRPYDFPIAGFSPPDEHPLKAVARFVNITREIQNAEPDLPVIAGGYTWLRHLMPFVASGVIRSGGAALIGQGRGSFAYPDSVQDILKTGKMDPRKVCVTCSACTQIMRDAGLTGCVVRDSEVYGPQYRQGRRFSLDRLQKEAERCRECEEPTCQSGCPAGIEIPAFLKAFIESDFAAAYAVLHKNNILPEMCGYVCPSEVQCEGNCVENIFCENPVAIRDIQLVVCRIARLKGLTGIKLPGKASGKSVAVVGGGPSGIACAVRLLELGHAVTLYEAGAILGGTPDTVIPGNRYGKAEKEIEAILKPAIEASRIDVKLDSALGKDIDLAGLKEKHDAVFLAMGLSRSVSLGEESDSIDALTFLRQAKSGDLSVRGKSVAVIGGGNTAMDAAGVAKAAGARDVYIVYRRSFAELPAWPEERDNVLKAGVHFLILSNPAGIVKNESGEIEGLKISRTELGEPDESGRRRPVVIANSESVLTVDYVIEAIGQEVPAELREALSGLELSRNGLIVTASGLSATAMAKVFAGGDIVNGGTTAVQGIAEGMKAAEEINRTL